MELGTSCNQSAFVEPPRPIPWFFSNQIYIENEEDEEVAVEEGVQDLTPADVVHRKKQKSGHGQDVIMLVKSIKLGFVVLVLLLVTSCVVFSSYSESLQRIVYQIHEASRLRTKTQQVPQGRSI